MSRAYRSTIAAMIVASVIFGCTSDLARPIVTRSTHGTWMGRSLTPNDFPSTAPVPAFAPDRSVARITKIGSPTWIPADFHVFSAPIGTAGSGYAEFLTSALAILPSPNHVFNPSLGVGPGAPHAPPYDSEISRGVGNAGFRQGHSFSVPEFSNGNGVWVSYMTVPNPGTTGSSPDFTSGRIIPNSLFPLAVNGVTYRNGRLFDPFVVGGAVPALDANLSPPFYVDGHSHFPMFIAENMDFAPPGTSPFGSYVFEIRMRDLTGSGWNIVVRFDVEES